MNNSNADNVLDFKLPNGSDGAVGKSESIKFSKRDSLDSSQSLTIDGGETMDHNKILEKYIDTVDKDRREMEKRITEERREMEKRITEERRLSEERMENRFNETMVSIKELSANVNKSVEKLENKVENTSNHIRNLTLTTIWSVVGISVAVMALVLTVIFS